MNNKTKSALKSHLNVLNNGLKLRRAVGPLFQQLHGFIEVSHIFCIHLEKGCKFLQNVPDTRCRLPEKDRDRTLVK